MKKIWYLLYNFLIIPLLIILFRVAGLFNAKIRQGIIGRRKLFENLIINLAGINKSKKMIWFHSSSMGEFEQAKPIIQLLKEQKDVNVVVTFFSPSGYNNSLNYPHADIISYLPFDTPYQVKRFLNHTKPDIAVFMRYDIWPNYIWQLKSRGIPTFIVDATMRKKSKRKLPVAQSFHTSLYRNITKILCVSEDDAKSFKDFKVDDDQLNAVGDTRFDRVYQKSLEAKNRKLLKENFFEGKKVFVLGSSWESDEEVMLPALLKLLKYDKDLITIIVPHEPTLIHLEKIENAVYGKEKSIRFSYLNNYSGERVIIIDSIGILLTLYYYADSAYVGGSFKQGIHNVLEPAVYGIPVFYGPKIDTSREAKILAERGSGIIVNNKREAYKKLRILFSDEEKRKLLGKDAFDFVKNNIGATKKILSELTEYI